MFILKTQNCFASQHPALGYETNVSIIILAVKIAAFDETQVIVFACAQREVLVSRMPDIPLSPDYRLAFKKENTVCLK